jgi:hypothetical protein
MNCYQLLQPLEDRLGYHQLPLNPGATGIRDVFEGAPLHHDWMVQLVRAIYAENRCLGLTDPVHRSETFKALAALRRQALHATTTDVELRALVEETGEAVNEIFPDTAADAPRAASGAPRGAEIIPFRAGRRRLRSSA